jgi:hypothetical protein
LTHLSQGNALYAQKDERKAWSAQWIQSKHLTGSNTLQSEGTKTFPQHKWGHFWKSHSWHSQWWEAEGFPPSSGIRSGSHFGHFFSPLD